MENCIFSSTYLQLFSAFFLLSSLPTSVSEIKNTHIDEDSRPVILFERFGFAKGGHVAISITNVTWKSKDLKAKLVPSSMGFFLARDLSLAKILNESDYNDGSCILSSMYATLIFKFENLNSDSNSGTGSTEIDDPDEYNLLFANCQPEFKVSMNVLTEMYNLRDGDKDFLPAGQTPLPKLYFLFSLVFTGFFLMWVSICINQSVRVYKIHLIIGALFFFKALKLICASEDKTFVRKTGTPHGWDVAFYIFGFFKGIMLFTVITLIGTGWSFLKPYLQERERNVLMIVIPLQVLENIAYVVLCETGPATKDWMTWNQMFLLVDIVCCAAVFYPIVWSIRSLEEASKTDGKAAKNLEKLTLFKQFYMVVVGYLYFTRFLVPAVGTMVNYKWEWLLTVFAEGASLALYVFIFCNFQPVERNPYLVIDCEEGNVASQKLEDDEFYEL